MLVEVNVPDHQEVSVYVLVVLLRTAVVLELEATDIVVDAVLVDSSNRKDGIVDPVSNGDRYTVKPIEWQGESGCGGTRFFF